MDAPWLRYLGFYRGDAGRPFHLIRDTAAGRVIKIAEGIEINGWSLVQAEGSRMTVRHNDDVYVVITR